MSLIEKIRKSRESKVTAGGFTFIIRRPTALEMIEIQNQPRGRAILQFVIGWENVTLLDMMPGGDPNPLDYDADVAAEWLTDRLDILAPLADAIFESYRAHEARLEDTKKN